MIVLHGGIFDGAEFPLVREDSEVLIFRRELDSDTDEEVCYLNISDEGKPKYFYYAYAIDVISDVPLGKGLFLDFEKFEKYRNGFPKRNLADYVWI